MLYHISLPVARKTEFKKIGLKALDSYQDSQDLRGRSLKEGYLIEVSWVFFSWSSSQSICWFKYGADSRSRTVQETAAAKGLRCEHNFQQSHSAGLQHLSQTFCSLKGWILGVRTSQKQKSSQRLKQVSSQLTPKWIKVSGPYSVW